MADWLQQAIGRRRRWAIGRRRRRAIGRRRRRQAIGRAAAAGPPPLL